MKPQYTHSLINIWNISNLFGVQKITKVLLIVIKIYVEFISVFIKVVKVKMMVVAPQQDHVISMKVIVTAIMNVLESWHV